MSESLGMDFPPTGSITAIHRMVDLCRAEQYPAMVSKISSGWVIMGERQLFAGYCLLLPDPVVPHLNVMAAASRDRFLSDMALVGDALLASTSALRGRAGCDANGSTMGARLDIGARVFGCTPRRS